MRAHSLAHWLLAVALIGGCGSSPGVRAADASVKRDLLRGVAEIRVTHDYKKLHAEVLRVLANLRRDRAATPATRRARGLAIEGFEATLKGVRSQLDFSENDSGNIAAATRDAKRADRYLTRGANRLRAAGRALGIRVGMLNGR
jgi:hypothetical protein